MGLTLNYRLRAPLAAKNAAIPALVARMHAAALAMKREGRVEHVGKISASPDTMLWLSEWISVPVPGEENTSRGVKVPVEDGHVFAVRLGEDCEPLRLGLCRYPDRVRDHQTGRLRVARGRGWRLSGFCKTQYASLHGWEHFRRCHLAAVDLLTGLRRLGLCVTINDEGGYWPRRDETELRRNMDNMNGIVAAFAGAMKDATAEGAVPVQSPIFAHPLFERIEADGAAKNTDKIKQVVEIMRRFGRIGPKP